MFDNLEIFEIVHSLVILDSLDSLGSLYSFDSLEISDIFEILDSLEIFEILQKKGFFVHFGYIWTSHLEFHNLRSQLQISIIAYLKFHT